MRNAGSSVALPMLSTLVLRGQPGGAHRPRARLVEEGYSFELIAAYGGIQVGAVQAAAAVFLAQPNGLSMCLRLTTSFRCIQPRLA